MKPVLALVMLSSVAIADVPGRDATDLHGDAMIRADAVLYVEPSATGTAVQFQLEAAGHTIPVKIVSSHLRDFVEVEIEYRDTCALRSLLGDARVGDLRFYVKRADLAPVVTQPFAIRYPNGTRARIAPGVPVVPTTDGYAITARGDRLVLPIPHTSVGYTYTLGKVVEHAPRGKLWKLDAPTSVKLGDTELVARGRWLANKPARHGATVKLVWSTRCIDLVVHAPAKHLVVFDDPHEYGQMFKDGGDGYVHWIPRGTPLSTVNHHPVGTATVPIRVAPPANGVACFDAQLTMQYADVRISGITGAFRLCANASAVQATPD